MSERDIRTRQHLGELLFRILTAEQTAREVGFQAIVAVAPAVDGVFRLIGSVYNTDTELAYFDRQFVWCDMIDHGLRWDTSHGGEKEVHHVRFTDRRHTEWEKVET